MVSSPLKVWLRSNPQVYLRHVASACGVHEGSVSRWLTGDRHCSTTYQLKIEKFTGGAVRPSDWTAWYVARAALMEARDAA